MTLKAIVCLMVAFSSLANSKQLCSSGKIASLRLQHNLCTANIRSKFMPTSIYKKTKVDANEVCQMIDETVFQCGKVYNDCYDEEGMK